ncbi:MAG: hypothetical protein OEO79_07000 [Gemmatimonadota bacterium]|nr:hypothetical protein [Gemmatimonadota bacterium]MDH3421743.1 hypothetical protein [Gemmatimonadota bacterium]
MRHYRPTLAVLLTLLAGVSACSTPLFGGETLVRFRNVSPLELSDFTYQSGGEAIFFPVIRAGVVTEYVEIDQSYRYGFVEFHVDSVRFVLQPIDYVGETLLGGGEFTFRVDVDTASAFGVSLLLED